MGFLLIAISSGCSKDDINLSNGWLKTRDKVTASDPKSIVGIWELKTLYYPVGYYKSPDDRDLLIFSSEGKVKVIKKTNESIPGFSNEDGEYYYSYYKGKQIILFLGGKYGSVFFRMVKCILKDTILHTTVWKHMSFFIKELY